MCRELAGVHEADRPIGRGDRARRDDALRDGKTALATAPTMAGNLATLATMSIGGTSTRPTTARCSAHRSTWRPSRSAAPSPTRAARCSRSACSRTRSSPARSPYTATTVDKLFEQILNESPPPIAEAGRADSTILRARSRKLPRRGFRRCSRSAMRSPRARAASTRRDRSRCTVIAPRLPRSLRSRFGAVVATRVAQPASAG